MDDKRKLVLSIDRSAETRVASRAQRQRSAVAPQGLSKLDISIHFLRGVSARSMFSLASFYLQLGADSKGDNPCTIAGYPGKVLQSQIHFASMNTIALDCRKAFDHGRGLTGAAFGRESTAVLRQHAKYWAQRSNRPVDDAYRALHFLRSFFATCSKPHNALFKDASTLGCRIGFLKQYADRSAAHLTLQDFAFDRLDVADVVAALTLVGSIICSFDNDTSAEHFNQIDAAAFSAASALFPKQPQIRLFEHMNIAMQAEWYWRRLEERLGLLMLTEQLPYAISWY